MLGATLALYVPGKGYALTFLLDEGRVLFRACHHYANCDPFLFYTREQVKEAARSFGYGRNFEIRGR